MAFVLTQTCSNLYSSLQRLAAAKKNNKYLQRLLLRLLSVAAGGCSDDGCFLARLAAAAAVGGWRLQKLVCGWRLRDSTHSTIKMRAPAAGGCKYFLQRLQIWEAAQRLLQMLLIDRHLLHHLRQLHRSHNNPNNTEAHNNTTTYNDTSLPIWL